MHKVTIAFKRGNKVAFRCKNFAVKTSIVTGEITGISWEGAENGAPLFVMTENIESIFDEEIERNDNAY